MPDDGLSVRITADSSDFISDVKQAAEAASSAFDKIGDSTQGASSQTRVSVEQIRAMYAEMGVQGEATSQQLQEAMQRIVGATQQAAAAIKSTPTAAPQAAPSPAAQAGQGAVTFSTQSVRDAIGDVTRLDATLKSAEASAKVFGTSVGASATAAAEQLETLSQASVVSGQSIQQAISAATGLDASNRSAADSAAVFERALGTQAERAAQLRDLNQSLAQATGVTSEATAAAIERVTGISNATKSAADSASVFERALGTQTQRAAELRASLASVAPVQAQASSAAQTAGNALSAEGQKALDLRTKLAQAQQQLAQFNAEIRKLASMPAGTSGMSEALRDTVAAAEATKEQVRGLSEELEAFEPKATSAGHATAGVTRELMVMGREAARGNWSRLAGSATILADRMGMLSMVMNPATIGFTAVAGAIALMAYNAEESERALGQIQASFEAAGRGAEYSEQRFSKLIETLRQIPGVSKGDAQGMLFDFSKDQDIDVSQYQALAEAVAGYARVTKEQVPEAEKEVVKALKEGEDGIMALNAQYHFLSPSQQQAIRDAQSHADKATVLKVAIEALQQYFGKLVTAGFTPMQTASERLGNALRGLGTELSNQGPGQTATSGLSTLINKLAEATEAAGKFRASWGRGIADIPQSAQFQFLPSFMSGGAAGGSNAGASKAGGNGSGSAGAAGNDVKIGDHGAAVGMFQLHEGAAQDVGLSSQDRYDYNQNIYGGSAYFLQRLKSQGGDLDAATRAYNQGDGGANNGAAQSYLASVKSKDVSTLDPSVSADIDAVLDQNFRGVTDQIRTRIKQIALQESGGQQYQGGGGGRGSNLNTPRETNNASPAANSTGGNAANRTSGSAAQNDLDVVNADAGKMGLATQTELNLKKQLAELERGYDDAVKVADQDDKEAAAADAAGDTQRAAGLRANADATRQNAARLLADEQEVQNKITNLHASGDMTRVQSWENALQKQREASGSFLNEDQQAEIAYWQNILNTEQMSAATRAQIETKVFQLKSQQRRQDLSEEESHIAKVTQLGQESLSETRQQLEAKVAAGQMTKDQMFAQLRDLVAQQKQADTEMWQHFAQTWAQFPKEVQKAQDAIAQVNQKTATELAQLDRQEAQSKRQATQEEMQLAQQALTSKMQQERSALSEKKQILQEEVNAGQTSYGEMIQQLGQMVSAQEAADIKMWQDFSQTYAQFPKAVQKAQDEIKQITAKANSEIASMNREAAQHSAQAWESAISPIESGFDGMVSNLMSGQKTFGQAAAAMALTVIEDYAKMALKAGEKWLAGELGMTTATQVQEGARTSASAAGAATRETIQTQETGSGFLGRIYHAVAQWLGFESSKTAATTAGTATRTAIENSATGTQVVSKAVTAWGAGETAKTAATASGTASRTVLESTETGSSFLGRIMSAVASWLGFETQKTAATVTGVATRDAAQASASATNVAEAMSSAATGAAAAGASVAAIPVTGWAMAPEVAAATYADLSAYAGAASFDVGAWELPEDQMAMVHKGEMILPAKQSAQVRAAAKSGSFDDVVSRVAGQSGSASSTQQQTGSSLADLIKSVNGSFTGAASSFSVPAASAGFQMPSVPTGTRELAMATSSSTSNSSRVGDLHFNPTINASGSNGMDRAGMMSMLRQSRDDMKGELLDMMRNGRLKLPGR